MPERHDNYRFHFHLAAAFPYDIRTGFDFDACTLANQLKREHYRGSKLGWDSKANFREFSRLEGIYFKSANQSLRAWWDYLCDVGPKYKFGRCETLPVISNAAGIARYVGAYVSSATDHRVLADKGMRTVRYSLRQRVAHVKFSWADGNGKTWRRGLQILGLVFACDVDGLAGHFGKNFQYEMRRAIFALGQGYDQALQLCAKIPEWADTASRMGFLYRLLNAVQTEVTFDMTFTNNTPDCPF